MYDLSSKIQTQTQISEIVSYFGYSKYQSDNLWDFLTKIIINTVDVLEEDNLVLVISGYAEAQRGSNQLWDLLIA